MNNDILNLVGKRLVKGEKKYGNENITSDGRDFVKEALEESLDLAVYVAAKLIEIREKEKQMGRAITMENRQDDFDRRLKLVEDALEEMIQTKVHHVDLIEETRDIRAEGVEIKPDEKFTPATDTHKSTHKRTTRKAKATATT
jgi:hypothetical protein